MKVAYWFRFVFFVVLVRLASCDSLFASVVLLLGRFILSHRHVIHRSVLLGSLNALGWVWRLWIASVEASWWEEDMVRWNDGLIVGFVTRSTASDTFFFYYSMFLLIRILVVFTIELY